METKHNIIGASCQVPQQKNVNCRMATRLSIQEWQWQKKEREIFFLNTLNWNIDSDKRHTKAVGPNYIFKVGLLRLCARKLCQRHR